jgi:ribosomal protein S18 acetylase RimI-like enzyme
MAGEPDRPMDRDAALDLQRRSLASFARVLGAGHETSRVLGPDGVTASVVPAVPDRSIMNSVAYRDSAALGAALDDLAAAYESAGVRAWTVWVPEDDRDAAELLEAAGHRLDATPTAMIADLASVTEPDRDELDWDGDAHPEVLGRINDLAYGWPEGTFAQAIGRFTEIDGLRLYQARIDGDPACVLGTYDVETDCSIYFVATLPPYRGQGLARRLLHQALAEAGERGMATSSLQSTKAGYRVYERLGYDPICKLEMWERRK